MILTAAGPKVALWTQRRYSVMDNQPPSPWGSCGSWEFRTQDLKPTEQAAFPLSSTPGQQHKPPGKISILRSVSDPVVNFRRLETTEPVMGCNRTQVGWWRSGVHTASTLCSEYYLMCPTSHFSAQRRAGSGRRHPSSTSLYVPVDTTNTLSCNIPTHKAGTVSYTSDKVNNII